MNGAAGHTGAAGTTGTGGETPLNPGSSGCGCQTGGAPTSGLGLTFVAAALLRRRRARHPARA
jgi:MYXO-CTERM domain-containing protein